MGLQILLPVFSLSRELKYALYIKSAMLVATLYGKMKKIYTALTKQAAKAALREFAIKWQHKYGYAVKSWQNN